MIKKQLYFSILAILILNACSANRDRMFGADIIEYTIPLTAKNEAKKIKRDSFNSEVYLDASEKLVQYSYAILMDKADRLMYADYYTAREYYGEALELFVTSKDYMLTALSLRHPNFDSKMMKKEEISFTSRDIPYLYCFSYRLFCSNQMSARIIKPCIVSVTHII